MICGSDGSGSFYRMTLTFYPTDKTADSLDILAANSSSSYKRGSIEAMRKVVSSFEPRVRKFVELVEPNDCYIWKIAHLPPLATWVSSNGRITLIGDAAHAMVPHLGAVFIFLFDGPPQSTDRKHADVSSGSRNSSRRRRGSC